MSNLGTNNIEPMRTDKRWWEFYFVRYFVGAVVGMGVMIFLNTSENSPLRDRIFSNIANKDVVSDNFILMAALGLAYCYIASAPVLVMHMVRSEMDFKKHVDFNFRRFFTFVISTSLVILAFFWGQGMALWSLQFGALSVAALVIGLQVMMIGDALRTKFDSVFDYYSRISQERAKRSSVRVEYIESYRHLREHGNSFLIVFFELMLAMTLSAVNNMGHLLVVVFLWISPACIAWFVGSYLESRLADVSVK